MGKKVALCTRYHFYERKNTELVCLPFFVLKQLGIKTVILQTSAGAVNLSYKVGDIVAINDHINMTGDNPLLGIVPVNFVNMSDCYDDKLLNLAHKIALKNKIELKDGVHLQVSGPNYETRAEIKMFRSFGADTVSMSTAYDCLIARYLNIKVLAFATIVNETSAEKTTGLNHKEVLENSKVASKNLIALISGIVKEM